LKGGQEKKEMSGYDLGEKLGTKLGGTSGGSMLEDQKRCERERRRTVTI